MTVNDQMIKLYSQQILRLASDIPLTDRLDKPDASAVKRSPLCGSTVTVDLTMDDGVITGYGQDVKACALGQASSAIFAAQVIGRTPNQVQTLRDELWAMLASSGPVPSPPFDGYQVLEPAAAYPNRHMSIMLAIDATLDAIADLA